MAVVDSVAEHDILEDELESSKPALPSDPEFAGLHFLLCTPFRYPPLEWGSRFGDEHERSLFYGSFTLDTAFAEVAFYRFLFASGTAATLSPSQIKVVAFAVEVETDFGVDLTAEPFILHRDQISSKTTYSHSQALGTAMRDDGAEAFTFFSARCPRGGKNFALFTPNAFAGKSVSTEAQKLWTLHTLASTVIAVRASGTRQTFEFARDAFLVG